MERERSGEKGNKRDLVYDITAITIILLFAVLVRSYRLGFPPKMYFDEIYYAKGAYNYLHMEQDSNWVHPPLGKILIAGGIVINEAFRNTCQTLGLTRKMQSAADWRTASLITGSLMIPLLYFMAMRMFRSRYIATVSIFLLSIEFLHFAESRIAMLDIFLCFFILLGFYFAYCYMDSRDRPYMYVILAGCCFGIASAIKWSGLFGAVGAFVAMVFLRSREPDDSAGTDAGESADLAVAGQQATVTATEESGNRNRFFSAVREKLIAALMIASIFLLCGIIFQILAYIPFFLSGGTPAKLFGNIKNTLHFHYKEPWKHPYLSQMWAWPTMIRPIWYLFEENRGKVFGIVAMGSPLFWWGFLIFLIELAILAIYEKRRLQWFLLIGYLSPYIFWIISNKGGFFYYMTPCVPWMALITAYGLERWRDTLSGRIMGWIYLAALLLFFGVFFGILAGFPVSRVFFNRLMWMRSWI